MHNCAVTSFRVVGLTLPKGNTSPALELFDHPLAEGQEKSEFAKQIQGFFLAFGQGVVILFFVGVFFCTI